MLLSFTDKRVLGIFLFQLKISLLLVSLHEDKIPSLQRPYLCCSPTSSVRHLCQVNSPEFLASYTFIKFYRAQVQILNRFSNEPLLQYVAVRTSMEAAEIEMLVIKDIHPTMNSSSFGKGFSIINPYNNEMHLLKEHQTLEEIQVNYTQQNLVRFLHLSMHENRLIV